MREHEVWMREWSRYACEWEVCVNCQSMYDEVDYIKYHYSLWLQITYDCLLIIDYNVARIWEVSELQYQLCMIVKIEVRKEWMINERKWYNWEWWI